MKYGVQLYSLRETAGRDGAEEVLRRVSEAGYDGVEFAGFYGKTPEEMKALLEKSQLVGISAHIRPEAIEESLPFIDALGIKYVFIPWVGVAEFEEPEKYAALIESTKKAKAILDARGVGFGYHNHAHEFENGRDYVGKILKDVDGLKAETRCVLGYGRGTQCRRKNAGIERKTFVCPYQGSGKGKCAGSRPARGRRRRR